MGGNGGAVDVVGDSAEEPENRLRGSWEEHGRCLRADELHAGLMLADERICGRGPERAENGGGRGRVWARKVLTLTDQRPSLPSLFLPLQSPPCYSAHSPWP